MKVAVTGATGFVGSHLVEALQQRGDEVVCLVRSPEKAAPLAARGCRLVKGDLQNEAALRELAEGAEVLHHVAGVVTSAGGSDADFMRVNQEGTRRVMAAARAASVRRVVYVSSLAASGPARRGAPLPDAAVHAPVTPYGRSKVAGEEVVRGAGVPYTIVRPPAIYGPRDRQFLPAFSLARRGFAPVMGDGRQELSLIHVRDLALALIAAGLSPSTEGRTYHAAHSVVVTQRELIASIGRAMGRERVRILPLAKPMVLAILHVVGTAADLLGSGTVLRPTKAPEFFAEAWTCSAEKAERLLGWKAHVSPADSIERSVRWYQAQGLL